MIDPVRVLRPLDAAEDATRRLEEYRSPAELAQAVRETRAAVEQTLRLLLRSDEEAPDAERLVALSSEELPLERVLGTLRSRERISMELAGTTAELARAAAREQVQAADADLALGVATRLRAEIAALAHAPEEAPAPTAVAPAEPVPADQAGGPRVRPFTLIAAVVSLLILVALIFALVRSLDDQMDNAVTAFGAGRLDEAAGHFEAVLRDAPENVTAHLYLARIYRRQGDYEAAAGHLRTAVGIAPDDADVRRELGHLFLQLNRPAPASEQYRRALELEPEDPQSWIGLIRALRAQGDPAAEDLLRQAPPEVRAALALPDTAGPT